MNSEQFIRELFDWRGLPVAGREALFERFLHDDNTRRLAKQLMTDQQILMDKWRWKNRIADIQQQALSIPNGTVGKPYETRINTGASGWEDVTITGIEGLEAIGLTYEAASGIVQGTPQQSGDWPLELSFTVQGAEEEGPQQKKLLLIVNPDPRSLWKEKPSDTSDPYWKEDTATAFDRLGDKHIAAASVRGRSHANAGAFRDDDFAYRFFDDTGWSLVAVADGAGSAKLARAGSAIACQSILEFFSTNLTRERSDEFSALLELYAANAEEHQKALSHFVYHLLSQAAYAAHQKLADTAAAAGAELKDFHTTLIFTLFKKHAAGYAVLSFGVGDCPMALLHTGLQDVTLMNWLDVGEFGGGTRFITLPEIFSSDKFSTRFRFKLVNDFASLVLMTDGVYDAKFVVEANLEKIAQWRTFMDDLGGGNEEGIRVALEEDNTEAAAQMARWLGFWSPGNHDDRTLVLVY